jgi:hypothetical protein
VADYSAIRDQIAVRLRTVSAFAVVFDTTPDRVTVPCAIVRPGSPVADYHEAMGGHSFITGSDSVETAIRGDTTLGGEASTSQVTSCTAYGNVNVADSQYVGAIFNVEVYAT